jgi:hypothetical protein
VPLRGTPPPVAFGDAYSPGIPATRSPPAFSGGSDTWPNGNVVGLRRKSMRRVLRILLNTLTTLSLLLFAATILLWVRSYWRVECVKLPLTRSPGAVQFHRLESSYGKLRSVRMEYSGNTQIYQLDWPVRDTLDGLVLQWDALPPYSSVPMRSLPQDEQPP